MFKFIAALLLIAIFLGGLVLFGTGLNWISTPSFLYQTLIFITFTTAVIFAYLYNAMKPDFFVQLYMLSMAVKLLAYSTYAYFMITSDKRGAFLNVAFFLLCYVIFTVVEIVFLYRKISSKTAL